jgi:putative phosphoribosyl transferase
MMFKDRRDAGRKLGQALGRFKTADPVVLALPRGGVPVGFEVAEHLQAPLDLLLVRKIGAPGHDELALGAVVVSISARPNPLTSKGASRSLSMTE